MFLSIASIAVANGSPTPGCTSERQRVQKARTWSTWVVVCAASTWCRDMAIVQILHGIEHRSRGGVGGCPSSAQLLTECPLVGEGCDLIDSLAECLKKTRTVGSPQLLVPSGKDTGAMLEQLSLLSAPNHALLASLSRETKGVRAKGAVGPNLLSPNTQAPAREAKSYPKQVGSLLLLQPPDAPVILATVR